MKIKSLVNRDVIYVCCADILYIAHKHDGLYREKERRSYVSDLLYSVQKKYHPTRTVENKPRKGRRKLFITRHEVGLNRVVKNNRLVPLHEITTKCNDNKEHSFSSRIIRRKLESEGYKRRAAKKNVIVCEVIHKKRGHCVGKEANGLLIRTGESIYILMKAR